MIGSFFNGFSTIGMRNLGFHVRLIIISMSIDDSDARQHCNAVNKQDDASGIA